MDNDIRRPAARAARTYERRVLSYQEAADIRPMAPVTVSESALGEPEPVVAPVVLPPAATQPITPPHTAAAAVATKKPLTIRLTLRKPNFRFERGRSLLKRVSKPFHSWRVRLALLTMVLAITATQVIPILEQHLTQHTYALGTGESLLAPKDEALASKLKYDGKTGSYNYNDDFNATGAGTVSNSGGPQIKAVANRDPSQGLQVTDPISNTSFTMIPKFAVMSGKQDGNRLIYPLMDGTGWVVYTMLANSVKEDVILSHANGNVMKHAYKIDVASQGLEVHEQKDGSIGVFGSSLPVTGNVSTGSDKDSALLQKARDKAKKDKLLFSLPTPVVYEANHTISKTVQTKYDLKGDTLTTVTTGLKARTTTFPLDIDPAVTVIGTSDLFRDTNADSNIDLNASTGAINRGLVTGGTIPGFTSNSNSMANARFMAGAAIYDDYAYVAGGAQNNSVASRNYIEYARMGSSSSTDYTIGTWQTTTSLPLGLSRFQLLAYNGYLYAIGGSAGNAAGTSTPTTNCQTANTNIYYNRIQTNGQLSASWSNATASLPTGVGCDLSAAIYNNVLYVAGGRTGTAATTATATVAHAALSPNGNVTGFTTDLSLPSARFDSDMRIYNGYIYIIGGVIGNTSVTTNAVLYAPLASDNSVYGTSWITAANSFATQRGNLGSAFTTISDGYIYLSGGCTGYNANGSCSAATPQSDTQIAQINADGSIGSWSTDAQAPLTNVGASLFAWRGTVYSLGGCTSANTASPSCASGSVLATQSYSHIAEPGQVGPLKTSAATTPDTPPLPSNGASTGGGLWAGGAAVSNGYLYVVGGCLTAGCTTAGANNTSTLTYYAPITASGALGAWQTDSKTLNGGVANSGLAAFSMAVYNNVLYVIGGYYYNTTRQTTILFAKPTANGSLAANWVTAGATLPAASSYQSSIAYRGYLYVFGGCTAANTAVGCSSYLNTVIRYTISTTDGTLSARSVAAGTVAALPITKALMATSIYNGYIYLSGGATGSAATGGNTGAQTNTTLYAKITDAGVIASWINGIDGTTGKLPDNPNDTGNTYNLRRASSYVMNGYLYIIGGHNAGDTTGGTGGTTYPYIFIGKINMSTGDIASFTQSVTQITARWDASTVFSNGYVYTIAGCSSGAPPASCASAGVSRLVEYVEVYNAGNKGTGTWASANDASIQKVGAASVAYNGYLYVAGGCTAYTVSSSTCTTFSNTVSYAKLNPDGTIGGWTSGGTLGASLLDNCIVGSGGYLYSIGGRTSTTTAVATVYVSQIGTNGVPGAWGTASTALTTAVAGLGCGVFNGRIYTTGGALGNGTAQALVYYSSDVSSGGNIASWTAGTAFTTARYNHASVISGGYLYILGGNSGSALLQDVQYIRLVPAGGTTGGWLGSTELPLPIQQSSAVAANGYIYLFGGRTAATTCYGGTWVASVNSTGTTSPWSTGANAFTTARFGQGGAFYNGYYYIIGGNDCSNNITSAASIQYGGEQSQAMKAVFSKYADLNGNGDPQKLVIYLNNAQLNGVDIEKWSMNYVSSREAANSWGQATTVNPLITQNAYNVNAYDGSGVDQTVSRWFYLSFSIDMTQSFTFTDDTQPKITQYGLHYSPPPSKRLLHGRDFRDQTQQGLDLKL